MKTKKKENRSAISTDSIVSFIVLLSALTMLALTGFPGGIKVLLLLFVGFSLRICILEARKNRRGPCSRSNKMFWLI